MGRHEMGAPSEVLGDVLERLGAMPVSPDEWRLYERSARRPGVNLGDRLVRWLDETLMAEAAR